MSVEKKVLQFLKDNPGATPREIADALGVPLNLVRIALTRLRESGHVVKSSRGGYLVRVSRLMDLEGYGNSVITRGEFRHHNDVGKLLKLIEELRKDVEELKNRVGKIESELKVIKLTVKNTSTDLVKVGDRGVVGDKGDRRGAVSKDRLIEELSKRKLMHVNEAKSYAKYPIETYITKGDVVLIANYIVSKDFFNQLKRKFPIRVHDIKKLSNEERILLDIMVREGLVYLHGGREYRLID